MSDTELKPIENNASSGDEDLILNASEDEDLDLQLDIEDEPSPEPEKPKRRRRLKKNNNTKKLRKAKDTQAQGPVEVNQAPSPEPPLPQDDTQDVAGNELKPNDIYQDDEDIPDDAQDQYPLPQKDPDFQGEAALENQKQIENDFTTEEPDIEVQKEQEYQRRAREYIQKLEKKRTKRGSIETSILLVSLDLNQLEAPNFSKG